MAPYRVIAPQIAVGNGAYCAERGRNQSHPQCGNGEMSGISLVLASIKAIAMSDKIKNTIAAPLGSTNCING